MIWTKVFVKTIIHFLWMKCRFLRDPFLTRVLGDVWSAPNNSGETLVFAMQFGNLTLLPNNGDNLYVPCIVYSLEDLTNGF